MKARWFEGSVRFRITPEELETLKRGGTFRETLILPGIGAVWSAAVRPANASNSSLTFEEATLYLNLAAADIALLVHPETEGVYFRDGDALRFYIEKDFPCIHPRPVEAEEPPTPTFNR